MATRSTRAALKIKEAMMQYSKKMCTRVTIFWMLYRLANFIVVLIKPEIAGALVDLSTGVDTIMIVNMGAYSTNSISEKVATAFVQRKALYPAQKDDDDEESEKEEENEEDNG